MMDIEVLKMEHIVIGIPSNDSTLVLDEKNFEVIVERKSRCVRRHFGIVDLWNIRRKAKSFHRYRQV